AKQKRHSYQKLANASFLNKLLVFVVLSLVLLNALVLPLRINYILLHISFSNCDDICRYSLVIFMFIFFRTKDLSVAIRFCTIHVAFTWFAVKIIDANNDVLFLIDWHG